MSRLQSLKLFINQRLAAAVEDIFEHFEKTIIEYEEDVERHHRKLLDVVNPNPNLQTHADVQQWLVVKEEVPPEQQEWSSSLDQEDPDPPAHIKEVGEELWSSWEGKQLQGLEADITKFTFTPVKSEDDEEKPQSSQLHQRQTEHMETEAHGEDCGGPEPTRNSGPDRYSQPHTEDKTGDCSETDDSADLKESRDPQSGLNSLKNVSDSRSSAEKKSFSCSVCRKIFNHKGHLNSHMRIHTGEKPYICSLCNKSFSQSGSLLFHMRIHKGEKPFNCSVCDKAFIDSGHMKVHMRVHTGEKAFKCSVCEKSFTQGGTLQRHTNTHTGKKKHSAVKCLSTITKGFV